MPAKPLTPEQLEDAARLREQFDRFTLSLKDKGEASSQEALVAALGFGQSALSQYLRGKIPLNGDALRKFCELLGCNPWDISPSIYQAEKERARYWSDDVSAVIHLRHADAQLLDEEAAKAFVTSDAEKAELIRSTVRAMLGLPLGKAETGPQQESTQAGAN